LTHLRLGSTASFVQSLTEVVQLALQLLHLLLSLDARSTFLFELVLQLGNTRLQQQQQQQPMTSLVIRVKYR